MEIIRFVDEEMDNIELIALIEGNITNGQMDRLQNYITEGYENEDLDGFDAIAEYALKKTFGNNGYEIPFNRTVVM